MRPGGPLQPLLQNRNVGLPGTPWSVKPSQQKSAKPHAQWRQAHAKLVPSKALFLPSWPRGPFLVWRKPALPRQAIAPSIPYIILLWEKNARRPGRERGTPSILEFYITDLVIGAVKAGGRVLRWRESTYLYNGRLRIRAGESYIVRSRPASTADARKDSFANIATHCEGIGSPLEWVLVMSMTLSL